LNISELYNKFGKQVYNLSLQYVQNKEDAEEITQDVFVSIYESFSTFQEKSSLSTWVYRITINKSLDFIKAKNRKKRFAQFTSLFSKNNVSERHELTHFDHPGVALEQKEAIRTIFKIINSLPENQKTALILSKIEGKSQQEIAEIMQISAKAVESLVQRAKSNLLKNLPNSEGN
jgi:RNA polymerase sigma-70 factor (ECF subfamily)